MNMKRIINFNSLNTFTYIKLDFMYSSMFLSSNFQHKILHHTLSSFPKSR